MNYTKLAEELIKNDRFKELVDEITRKEESQVSKEFRPEVGEGYYYVNTYGEIYRKTFNNDAIDKQIIEFQGVFSTEELAIQKRDRNLLLREIKLWADEYNGDWEPDWSDLQQGKYYFYLSCRDNELRTGCFIYVMDLSPFYFKDEDFLKPLIAHFGEERLQGLFKS